jgi:type IV secretory pathway TrbD component
VHTDPQAESHDNAHVVHGSLVRPTLTLGVERHVAALEFTLCLALILGIGVRLPTVCLVAVVVLLAHPTLVWLTARDPLATQIYVRSRAYADYYAPHASARSGVGDRVPRPRPSLPRAR